MVKSSLIVRRITIWVVFLALLLSLSPVTVQDVEAARACTRNRDCNNDAPFCDNEGRGRGTCEECITNDQCKATRGSDWFCSNSNTCERGIDDGRTQSGYTQAYDTDQCVVRGKQGMITEIGCVPKDPIGFAAEYYTYGLGLIGGISVVFLIIGGYILLTSSGDPQRLRDGKTYIFYAIFGLLLAIFGYVFIEVIAIDILRIPGFQR